MIDYSALLKEMNENLYSISQTLNNIDCELEMIRKERKWIE